MKVAILPVTPFQQNCSILVDEATGRCAVVDPGGDIQRILEMVKTTGATLEKIFVTHGPASTFDEERETNPFVSDDALARQ